MMPLKLILSSIAACLLTAFAPTAAGQAEPITRPATRPDEAVVVPGRIVEVACYENSALVIREVEVPAGAGLVEVTVGPLPPSMNPNTLYAESEEAGVRVLTTRFRQRIERDATDDRVRDLTAEMERLAGEIQLAEARRGAIEQDIQFTTQLQTFTTSSLNPAASDADLQAAGFIEFVTFISERRAELMSASVEVAQEIEDLREQQSFTQLQLNEAQAGGGNRVVREATIVVDNTDGNAATVRLAYLVGAAGWRPQYRLRAEADAESATLEYLAAVYQQTGEDWSNVRLTLSTATPNLNASPPELEPVQVALLPRDAQQGQLDDPAMRSLEAAADELRQAQSAYGQEPGKSAGDFGGGLGGGGLGGGGGGGGGGGDGESGAAILNRAAARVLEAEVLGEPSSGPGGTGGLIEGQSVTFKLDGLVSVPWRDDEQLLEIARQSLEPDVFYKAVPVLTPNVYRVADLTNDGENARVILPGPCSVYLGGDFVGRTDLPLVAIGRPFTIGLGIDPQLTVTRQLVSRDNQVSGGNQIRTVEYALRIESFKDAPVPLRLWDRLPTGPDGDTSALEVELIQNSAELSDDPEYVRDERPNGLLRWDMTLTQGEPVEIRFAYTLAFDRALEIGGFQTK